MKLMRAFAQSGAVAGLLAAALLLSSCGSSNGRTAELPGGGPSEAEIVAGGPNWFERMIGRDDRPNAGACPLMGVLYESSRLVEFVQPGNERYSNVGFTGEVRGVRGLCRYVDDNPIEMALDIDMAFGRGPAATTDQRTYRYWVAVVRRSQRGAPIEKQYFDLDVRFPGDQAVVTRQEQIERIVIPRANAEVSGDNFEILVGFELTPDQLQYNRDGKRFRIDAGS
jgi:hypothetical protein